MSKQKPDEYATQLWQARLSGEFCDPIHEELSVAQAYAIQKACTDAASTDEKVLGYKIGATSKETLDFLGLQEPFYGPLYKSAFATNDGLKEQLKLKLFMQHKPRAEAEFVVSIKSDIKRGNVDLAIDDISDHIEWVAPGLEIVASRFSQVAERPGCLAIADFGANQYMVVGAPYKDWRTLNLAGHPVTLAISEQPVINGHSGMSIFGNPLEFVCWLLNQPDMHDVGLRTGQLVSCGTCTGAPFITEGDHITADYGVLGRLAIQIDAKSDA